MEINKILIISSLLIFLLIPISLSVNWAALNDLSFEYVKQQGVSIVSQSNPDAARMIDFYYKVKIFNQNPSKAMTELTTQSLFNQGLFGSEAATLDEAIGIVNRFQDPSGYLIGKIEQEGINSLPEESKKGVITALRLKPYLNAIFSDDTKVSGTIPISSTISTTGATIAEETSKSIIQDYIVNGKIKNMKSVIDIKDEEIKNEAIIADLKAFAEKYGYFGEEEWSIETDGNGDYIFTALLDKGKNLIKRNSGIGDFFRFEKNTKFIYRPPSKDPENPIITYIEIIPVEGYTYTLLENQPIGPFTKVTSETKVTAKYNDDTKRYKLTITGLESLQIGDNTYKSLTQRPMIFDFNEDLVEFRGKYEVFNEKLGKKMFIDGSFTQNPKDISLGQNTRVIIEKTDVDKNHLLEYIAEEDSKLIFDDNPLNYRFSEDEKNAIIISKGAEEFKRIGAIDTTIHFNSHIKEKNLEYLEIVTNKRESHTPRMHLPILNKEAVTYFDFNKVVDGRETGRFDLKFTDLDTENRNLLEAVKLKTGFTIEGLRELKKERGDSCPFGLIMVKKAHIGTKCKSILERALNGLDGDIEAQVLIGKGPDKENIYDTYSFETKGGDIKTIKKGEIEGRVITHNEEDAKQTLRIEERKLGGDDKTIEGLKEATKSRGRIRTLLKKLHGLRRERLRRERLRREALQQEAKAENILLPKGSTFTLTGEYTNDMITAGLLDWKKLQREGLISTTDQEVFTVISEDGLEIPGGITNVLLPKGSTFTLTGEYTNDMITAGLLDWKKLQREDLISTTDKKVFTVISEDGLKIQIPEEQSIIEEQRVTQPKSAEKKLGDEEPVGEIDIGKVIAIYSTTSDGIIHFDSVCQAFGCTKPVKFDYNPKTRKITDSEGDSHHIKEAHIMRRYQVQQATGVKYLSWYEELKVKISIRLGLT